MGRIAFEAQQVSYTYAGATGPAVRTVSLAIANGELVAIVGPNGGGKTTLLRLLLGLIAPDDGEMLTFGRPATAWKRQELAKVVGVVSQREEPAFPLLAWQAVLFGRYPHLGPLGATSTHDHEVVDRVMERCDVAQLRDRWVATLSGGEWQRVRVARALAQEPDALVLDEATANLDVRHEMEVFELIAELVRENDLAGVLVTHHVNLAARYADRIVVMDHGAARAIGRPSEVLTRDLLERVYGWPVELSQWRGVPQFVPLKREEASRHADDAMKRS